MKIGRCAGADGFAGQQANLNFSLNSTRANAADGVGLRGLIIVEYATILRSLGSVALL